MKKDETLDGGGDQVEATSDDKQGWRPPTRRAFVAMLGAAAAAITLRDKPPVAEPPRSTWTGRTRWIGHC